MQHVNRRFGAAICVVNHCIVHMKCLSVEGLVKQVNKMVD